MTVVALRSVSGRVVDSTGRPVSGANVRNPGNPAPFSSAVTGSYGTYPLEGLPPGEPRLFVEAAGFRFHGHLIGSANTPIELKIRRIMSRPSGPRGPRGRSSPCAEAAALACPGIAPYSEKTLKPGTAPDARSRVLEVLRYRSRRSLAEVPGRRGSLEPQRRADRGDRPVSRQATWTTPCPSSPRSRMTSGEITSASRSSTACPPPARKRKRCWSTRPSSMRSAPAIRARRHRSCACCTPAAKSLAALLLARLPARDGSRPRKGAPLEAGADLKA